MNILYIGSRPPSWSAGLADSQLQDFINKGHNVDFITGYYYDGMYSNVYSAINTPKQTSIAKKNLIKYYINNPKELFIRVAKKIFNINQYFPLENENQPLIFPEFFANAIPNKEYSFAIVGFMEDVISTVTLKAIYTKINCPIFIFAVDMQPMTGGCLYFWNCKNYKKECKDCPVLILRGKNRRYISYENFLIKRKIYESIDVHIFCNDWMKEKIIDSTLFPIERIRKIACNINTNLFCPIEDISNYRNELNLPKEKFIIFVGASDLSNPRKGIKLMIKSINYFTKQIKDKDKLLMVIAGRNTSKIAKKLNIEVKQVGFVNSEKLSKLYAVSDLFLSSTIEDAGPSMVNQSLSCGTPIVAYNIGVACELVITGKTGYLAKNHDYKDFANGIKKIYLMDKENRDKMRKVCREIQIEHQENYSSVEYIENILKEIKAK